MNQNLSFLTKSIVDEAVVVIDKNGFAENREGTKYAVLINNKRYPYKLLVTEAAKIAKVSLNSNDFKSDEKNRNDFQELTGYPITATRSNEMEYVRFKKLLEYFIAHLEWLVNEDNNNRGYREYINPLIENNTFKRTGQGYAGAQIQQQIKEWDQYENGKICINIQPNFGSYKSSKAYLNWLGTGLNIIVNWKDNQIISLQQEEYLYWEENPSRVQFGYKFSIEYLGLFEFENRTSAPLIRFYEKFNEAIVKHNNFEKLKRMEPELKDKIELLKYKKQIILQGPPGTGKTRLAKEIAEKITANNSLNNIKDISIVSNLDINIYDILNNFKIDEKISSSNGKTSYLIKEIKSDRIILTGDSRKVDDTIVFETLIDCLNNREKYTLGTGLNSQYNAVADYVEKLKEDSKLVSNNFSEIPEMDQNFVKLIQFHPSYTYEDFVRGIVAKPNPDGKGIIYEAENKTLGLFTKIALENYVDSKKNEDILSYEKWIYSIFEKFVEHIKQKINTDSISLTEKVNIVSVDEDAFRYKGKKGWTKLGNRMLFEDIIKSIIDKNTTRQQLKNNSNLSGLAQWHASYYIRVVDLFNNFINESKLKYIATKETKIEEKNYVLIIDEINRANLSSVLGELIYALEYRGEAVESMYAVEDDNNNKLTLPPNLYIIGTMNTADRSVGHIDYAIRRRFAFVDVLPQDLSDDNAIIFDRKLFLAVKELFTTDDYKTHSAYLSKEFECKDVALGHSYFIDKSADGGSMEIRLEYEIKPILLEYVKDGVLIGDEIKTKIEDLKASI